MENILEVNNLNICFDRGKESEKVIIKDGKFNIAPGELVLILGDNGAGKSTIFNALLGFLPESATFSIDMKFRGKKVDKNTFRTSIGYSEQISYDGKLFGEKVIDYIFDYAKCANENEGFEKNYEELFKKELKCDLYCDGKLNSKRLKYCSGGEKQIVSILRTFSRNHAPLYLLDEPINNLDSKHARLLNNFIIKMKQKPNPPAILIVTHCQMFQSVDKAYRLKNGRLNLLDKYEPKSCFGECDKCGNYKED